MVEKVNRLIRTFIAKNLRAVILAGILLIPAESSGLTLISDEETQNYLAKIVKPLYKAAGVTFDANKIFIVNDNSLNAFVSDGNYLFVHTGTLISADDTNELSGILAHETGHIMGGHIVRQKLKMDNMQYVMLGSMIAAGAAALSTGRGDAAMAMILGSQSSAMNSMLNYQLQEERNADESAVKILKQTKQSAAGLKRFMDKIKKNNALSGMNESAYFRTHPMTGERIRHFEEAARTNPYGTAHPEDSKFKFIKAKLAAFLEEPEKVWRKYPAKNNDDAARYAHAILYFREGNIARSLDILNKLQDNYPQNPYFYELTGQFLFESGKVKDSIAAYRKALKLLPNSALMQISLAQSLLENGDQGDNHEVITLLQKSLISSPSSFAWQLLARAYEIGGNRSAAHYATAEFNYTSGNFDGALKQLKLAETGANTKQLKLKIADLAERIRSEKKERGTF